MPSSGDAMPKSCHIHASSEHAATPLLLETRQAAGAVSCRTADCQENLAKRWVDSMSTYLSCVEPATGYQKHWKSPGDNPGSGPNVGGLNRKPSSNKCVQCAIYTQIYSPPVCTCAYQ